MRFTTYSKYHPELGDAVNLQGLLDQLGDFLLQSGFAGNSPSFWHCARPFSRPSWIRASLLPTC